MKYLTDSTLNRPNFDFFIKFGICDFSDAIMEIYKIPELCKEFDKLAKNARFLNFFT